MKLNDAVCFDDVLLVPQYSDISSRRLVDLMSTLPRVGPSLGLPIVSSPMDTVTGVSMAITVSLLGGLSIIHRYNTIEEQSEIVYTTKNAGSLIVGAAVGVSGDFLKRARSLAKSGADVVCIDIAHGHHIMMKHALIALRNDPYTRDLHLMAGNVATLPAFNDLADWGADSIRVGIGGGSICSTRVQTGHGVPTLQSIIDCATSDRGALLVADGGIRNSGDMVKAIAAGADLVMVGSLLSGTDEAPGDIIERCEMIDGLQTYNKFKAYRGMASKEAQIAWRGYQSSEEGVSSVVPYKGPATDVLKSLETGIRSGLSYSGVTCINELQSRAKFIRQSSAGAVESSAHIMK